ncbi:AraC family transcriptional regulator [Kibdelosporangium philippinense]|uniref:AraC family transcriptional regulator n=1 Tax=Kibdelosporangium philippinense TaxID=211113 RepID=A0ABS8ZTF4_9PSEU|nr:AraC family transcriptional regulator [Kibdelosporangium philippinense]MCE7011010.1 AraC family transcriptional regulator [Kibdelosporangium philippinense]
MRADISESNKLAGRALPSKRLLCSEPLGWQSMLARTYRDPDVTDEFTTVASSELTLVVALSGTMQIESRKGRGWHRANYRPGSAGLTAPGNVSVLRWKSTSPYPLESLHLHLPVDEYWAFDSLLLEDPLVAAAGNALKRALQQSAPEYYAESITQMLVAHLMYTANNKPAVEPLAMGRSGLDQVTEYMRAHLSEDIRLDELAALVSVSKYHFLRMFTRATGQTPHRYLTELRMARAAEMLRDNDKTVLQVAIACGYRSPGQFAAAFRRRYGVSPTEFRNFG